MAAETFEQFLARTGLPFNDTGWVAYVGSGSSDASQRDVAEAQARQAQGLSTGGAQVAPGVFAGANPGYATDTYGTGPGANSITLAPGQVAAANAAYQRPGYGYPQMPGYPGGGMAYGRPANVYQGGPYAGMPTGGGAGVWNGYFYDEPTQGGRYGGGMGYGQQPTQRAAVQPYTRPVTPQVPLAHQVAPWVWDSMSPVARELAYGAVEANGQDAGEYERMLNAARPQGQAPRTTTTRYGPQRNYFSGGF